jgi:sterol desaturase/sphingolipid hydroxylase (fatty acid hydroxylase superfamily)
LSALVALVVGPALGIAYVLGFMVSYGGYEVHHRREHTHAGGSAYGRWARRHHFYHHFVDGRSNHGVTSPLWDFVFGTYRKADKIPVPPRLCMEWLKDPLTGGIRERFADTFVLGRAGRHVEPPTE